MSSTTEWLTSQKILARVEAEITCTDSFAKAVCLAASTIAERASDFFFSCWLTHSYGRSLDFMHVSIEPYGLWSKSGNRSFIINGAGTNCSEETNARGGGTIIPVVSLDEYLKEKHVTFIKMDIEGSEMEALRGAEHIIRTQHPKLAISVYHCRDDVWRVPMLLLEYYPAYRLYYRVYAFSGV